MCVDSHILLYINVMYLSQALTELERIHGPIVKKHYEEGIIYMWDKNRHSHGGFIHRQPTQKYSLVVGGPLMGGNLFDTLKPFTCDITFLRLRWHQNQFLLSSFF